MPSKKKLRKQNRKLRDQFEHLYSSYQRTGREAWEAREARDKAVRELDELRTAARELVHALDNGRQDDIPTRKDAVRDLLPGEPWTLGRIMRLQSIMHEIAAALSQPIDREIIERDWTDDLPDEAPKLAEAVEKAREDGQSVGSWTVTAGGQFVPIVDPHKMFESGGQTRDMGPRPTISRDGTRKPRVYTDEDHQVWTDSSDDAA